MDQGRIETREVSLSPEIIEKVRALLAILRSEGVRISSAYLYGSYATKHAHPDSDIDVAIISPDLSGDRLQDWLRLTLTATDLDTRFDVVGFRPEQFRDEHPLVWEIKQKGILVK
ncbi:MAG: nucleotidyltransferase domain-containing protein [Chloroflexi bacterium]|nr:nucleotidyltransferase domain-containing protein [Chloroflexota bacterium]